MIEFPLIFGEINFKVIPKSMKSAKFVVLEKGALWDCENILY